MLMLLSHSLTLLLSRSQIIISQLNESIRTGQWLILQSAAHTKTQIIKRINHLLDIKESNEFHQDFRLWIILRETKAFPLEMLQRSFKGLSQFIHNGNVYIVTKMPWTRYDSFWGCCERIFQLMLMCEKKCLFIVTNSCRRMNR